MYGYELEYHHTYMCRLLKRKHLKEIEQKKNVSKINFRTSRHFIEC